MDEKEFFTFASDEYNAELALANSLYQRGSVLVTAVVIVGGAAYSISRIDLIGQARLPWLVLLLHLSLLLAVGSLAFSVAFIFATVMPRDYPKLGKMYFWCKWREDYKAILDTNDPNGADCNRTVLAEATLQAMLSRLVDAQTRAAWLNTTTLKKLKLR